METVLRQDLAWRPLVLAVGVVVALTLLWRRTRPLAAVAVAFGTLTAVDVARILAVDETGGRKARPAAKGQTPDGDFSPMSSGALAKCGLCRDSP